MQSPVSAEGGGAPVFPDSTLDNGLRIVSAPMPHVRSVTTAFFLGAGSRYETDAEAGLSHFVEHMVFKGTKKRPLAKVISETIEGVGGYLNASTDREATVYWAKVAAPHFDLSLDLLVDMLRNSLYEPGEIERERKVILEELAATYDSPAQLVDLLIDETMWPGEALGRDIGGSRESVSGIMRPQLVDYVADQYAPDNCVVAVAGQIEHEQVVAAVEAQLGSWGRRRGHGKGRAWERSASVGGAGQDEPRVGLKSRRTEQAHLCIAYPGLSSSDPERYALDLLNVVLGEGMSSRLFLRVREELGLAYDVHSYAAHFLDDGAVTVYAGVEPKQINGAIKAILGEIRGVMEPIGKAELRKAKEMIKGRLLLRTEDTRSMAAWAGGQLLLLGELRSIDEVVEIVEALTAEDLRRAAERVFSPEKVNLAVVGPYRSEARFERLAGAA